MPAPALAPLVARLAASGGASGALRGLAANAGRSGAAAGGAQGGGLSQLIQGVLGNLVPGTTPAPTPPTPPPAPPSPPQPMGGLAHLAQRAQQVPRGIPVRPNAPPPLYPPPPATPGYTAHHPPPPPSPPQPTAAPPSPAPAAPQQPGGMQPGGVAQFLQGGLGGGGLAAMMGQAGPPRTPRRGILRGHAGEEMIGDLKNIGTRQLTSALKGPLGPLKELGTTLVRFPGYLQDWGDSLIESRRAIAAWNGQIAGAMLEQERRQIVRGIGSGQRTAFSTRALVDAMDDLLDEVQPLKDVVTNSLNLIVVLLTRGLTTLIQIAKILGPAAGVPGMIATIALVVQEWQAKNKAMDPNFVQFIQQQLDLHGRPGKKQDRPKRK